ncbi:SSI family serine proteinase inhibitor [Streptomyces bauhiniae]|uniref:SSI family serine proteinase inhibitor n=1 Tax=Streptomyces bauhiniae TaxID=2340725 RepID=UPI00331F9CCE
MSALSRRGIASLGVSAVPLLCGLAATPADAAPGSVPAHAYSAAPARALHTVPVRTAPVLAFTPTRAHSASPAHAAPPHTTSASPAHAGLSRATSAHPTSAHLTSAAPPHATSPAPPRLIPTTPAHTALTPVLPPPPLPDDRTTDHLTLVVHGVGPGRDGVRQLFCHPEGGDHPDPGAACRVLDENTQWGRDTFAPVPPDSVCTMIDGGPATAHVTGYWAGRPVDAEFSRRNGCEIARWDRLVPFLPGARS